MQGNVQDQFDVMVDFGYPVVGSQIVRQSLNQALYALQQKNQSSASAHLQDAVAYLATRMTLSPEDADYIQAMIAQITALLKQLEQEDQRSLLQSYCHQIQAVF